MIKEVTMYQAVCDRCGAIVDEEYMAWSEEWMAIEEAIENDWKEISGKLYCPDCYEIEDDELTVKL
ncbi:MAG: hypothetical protein GX885_11475 [Methanomicrobiales archaeon]|nr:hypothetical protein [Methanomicrobiales archaeon]